MANPNQDGVAEILLSLQQNTRPRNFLDNIQPYSSNEPQFPHFEPELNLQLSLGGPYNAVVSEKSPLINYFSLISDDNGSSSSVQTREDQTMRRIDAMKWRSESRPMGGGGVSQREKSQAVTVAAPPPIVQAWAAESASKNTALLRAIQTINTEGRAPSYLCPSYPTPSIQGPRNLAAAKGPSDPYSGQVSSREMEDGKSVNGLIYLPKPVATSSTVPNGKPMEPSKIELGSPSKKAKCCNPEMPECGMELIKSMPTVTTTGGDPNGRKIEGFLFKYRNGKVCIVCICHGKFLTPAEFVMHASGAEVENPMKQIKVVANSI
ncbi:unnamed protein product [Ilex paraguariensis]|uniref:Ninja-family protein n=1 Tax=Ilex paraguariensis TaxID=185542 RepID=A0ABC8RSK0_9AQUA